MANNRLFLIHQPTGLGLLIAKSSGLWYECDNALNDFLEMVNDQSKTLDEVDDIVSMGVRWFAIR